MPSHVHVIFRSALEDPSGLMRDLTGFASRKIMKPILDNPQDPSLKGELVKQSRREWILRMFERAGKINSNVKEKQFWQQSNK